VTIDRLFDAFITRDRASLPLAADIRYTENGQSLRVGDGLWSTLSRYVSEANTPQSESSAVRPPHYRIDFADHDGSQSVYFGGTLETATPGMLALRMKVRGDRISEIEAVCVREEKPGERGGTVTLFQPSLLTQFAAAAFQGTDPELLRAVSRPRAQSRSELPAVVDRYFDAVESDDSREVAFTDDCQRRDNGVRTTGDAAAAPLDPDVPGYRPFSLGCAQQIDSGFFTRISQVRGRRHIAVDERRGLVLTVSLWDQPGNVAEIQVPRIGRVALPSGIKPEDLTNTKNSAQFYVKRYEPNFRVPMTELTVQLTKVQAGRIARIESISRGAPYGLTSGWL
jgi:hypothetical protein